MAFLLDDISNFGALNFYNGSGSVSGPTGSTGSTGPSQKIPNGSFETSQGDYFPVSISNTYSIIASTFVTITQPSKLWTLATAQFQNTDNNTVYVLSTFITVNSLSSYTNVSDIPERLDVTHPSTTPVIISQVSQTEPIGVYKSVLYGRTTAPTTTVTCTHCDIITLGNLA